VAIEIGVDELDLGALALGFEGHIDAARLRRVGVVLGGVNTDRQGRHRLAQRAASAALGKVDGFVAAHGVLSVCDRAQVRRSALLEVVLPCGRALLGAHSGCLKMPSRAACQITATAG
jgi:hypothetical protein